MRITDSTVVVITGAGSGIGRELALQVAGRGAQLALIGRRADVLESAAAEARAAGASAVAAFPCDVADRAAFGGAIERILQTFGRVDVMVHNAGSGHFAYVEETPEEHLEKVFGVNVFALWHGTAPLLPLMRERGKGLILIVSSFAGAFPFPANAAYIAAKHAAVGFGRALRAELAGSGVDVSVVLPAGTMTDWASVTEGGPMLPLFEYEAKRSVEIAAERGTDLPQMPALLPAAEVARQIAELMETERPQPELFTHPGTHELACRYLQDPQKTGERLEPFWLASREGYVTIKKEG